MKMSNVFQFDNFKTHLEVDIAGKVINIPLDDENSAKQQKAVIKFRDTYHQLQAKSNVDFETISEKDVEEIAATQTKIAKDLITDILGEEEYDRLFELAGKSTPNLMSVVHFLIELLTKETQRFADEAKEKYLSNAKISVNK